MMRARCGRLGALAIVMAIAGCGDISDADGLADALASARPGDEVRVGAGEIVGSFDVPAGVTLVGAGADATRIVATHGSPALTLAPGAPATSLRGLSVVASGSWGVVARGPGDVSLDDVTVEVPETGVGIGFEGLSTLTLTNVAVRGPVTAENASSVTGSPSATESAPYGFISIDVASATVDGIDVSGFASFGALAIESTIALTGGEIHENLGVGLMLFGGSGVLTDMVVRDTFAGTRLLPAYNVLVAGGATVSSTGLESLASEGYGVVLVGSSGTHQGLVSNGNATTGLWIQECSDVSVTDATLDDNGQAGVVVLDSEDIALVRVSVSRTRLGVRLSASGTSSVELGDGIQIVDAMRGLEMQNLELVDNTRVGLLLHMQDDDLSTATMGAISVEGSGEMLGVVAQGGSVPAGWDDTVERSGDTLGNDAAFAGVLDIVEIVAPTDFPRALDFMAFGLEAIVAPTD